MFENQVLKFHLLTSAFRERRESTTHCKSVMVTIDPFSIVARPANPQPDPNSRILLSIRQEMLLVTISTSDDKFKQIRF